MKLWQRFRTLAFEQISQGASPRGLALSCALASIFGTFPLLGTTTVLCLIFGSWLRANQPMMQIINYLLSPIQLILIPVYLTAGQWLAGGPKVVIGPRELMELFAKDPRSFLETYGIAGLHAVTVWAMMAPLLGTLIYFLTLPIFRKLVPCTLEK